MSIIQQFRGTVRRFRNAFEYSHLYYGSRVMEQIRAEQKDYEIRLRDLREREAAAAEGESYAQAMARMTGADPAAFEPEPSRAEVEGALQAGEEEFADYWSGEGQDARRDLDAEDSDPDLAEEMTDEEAWQFRMEQKLEELEAAARPEAEADPGSTVPEDTGWGDEPLPRGFMGAPAAEADAIEVTRPDGDRFVTRHADLDGARLLYREADGWSCKPVTGQHDAQPRPGDGEFMGAPVPEDDAMRAGLADYYPAEPIWEIPEDRERQADEDAETTVGRPKRDLEAPAVAIWDRELGQ